MTVVGDGTRPLTKRFGELVHEPGGTIGKIVQTAARSVTHGDALHSPPCR